MNDTRRRVVIATDASISLKSGFVEQYRVLVVPRRYRIGQQTVLSVDGPAQFVSDRTLPELLPAQLDDFIATYRQIENASIFSIHSAATIDNAIQQARIARNLLSPGVDLEIFEAKTIDGGVQLLVETAADFVNSEKDATKEQVQALLERIHGHILTLVLCKGTGRLPCETRNDFFQELANLFGPRLMFKMDSSKAVFKQIISGKQERELMVDNRTQILVQWKHQTSARASQLFAEMTRMFGRDAFAVREIYLRNPIFPDDFIGIVAYPDSTRIAELVKWVKRWG